MFLFCLLTKGIDEEIIEQSIGYKHPLVEIPSVITERFTELNIAAWTLLGSSSFDNYPEGPYITHKCLMGGNRLYRKKVTPVVGLDRDSVLITFRFTDKIP